MDKPKTSKEVEAKSPKAKPNASEQERCGREIAPSVDTDVTQYSSAAINSLEFTKFTKQSLDNQVDTGSPTKSIFNKDGRTVNHPTVEDAIATDSPPSTSSRESTRNPTLAQWVQEETMHSCHITSVETQDMNDSFSDSQQKMFEATLEHWRINFLDDSNDSIDANSPSIPQTNLRESTSLGGRIPDSLTFSNTPGDKRGGGMGAEDSVYPPLAPKDSGSSRKPNWLDFRKRFDDGQTSRHDEEAGPPPTTLKESGSSGTYSWLRRCVIGFQSVDADKISLPAPKVSGSSHTPKSG